MLLVNWSKAEPKPVQQGRVGGIRFRSTIPFLQWLVQRLEPGALASVTAHEDCDELNAMEALDAHIAAEIHRLRTSSGGGAARSRCAWRDRRQLGPAAATSLRAALIVAVMGMPSTRAQAIERQASEMQ